MNKFSENLKKIMKERRLTYKLVSQNTGIPQSTLSEWCSGREAKFNENILKLSQFLQVDVEFLLTGIRKEPEQEMLGDILSDLSDGFTTIHKGVYRLKVEKYTGSLKKNNGDTND